MNKKILQSVLWGFILILSSCRSSQPPYDGTYEGILPAADCPGIYVLLTINGGQYELLEKYITRPGTFVTYGKAGNLPGDKILLDNKMELKSDDGRLLYKDTPLKRISLQTELPELCTSQLLKESQSGENVTLKLYEKQGEQYADFLFKAKKHILKLKEKTDLVSEYADKNCSLKVPSEQKQSSVSDELVFNDGTNSYTFDRLTPDYCIYSSATKTNPTFFDVVYYTAGEKPMVKLISTAPEHCYTLFQTEASAKTAEYSDGKVEWRVGNHKNATFVVDNKEYEYNEQ